MQKKLIENADYFIRLVRFPNYSTPAQVWVNDDGTFDIYVDDRLPDISAAVAHELEHIERDHFYDDTTPIAQIENEANGKWQPTGTILLFRDLDAVKKFAEWKLQCGLKYYNGDKAR